MGNIISPCKFCGQDVHGTSMPLTGAFHPECLTVYERGKQNGRAMQGGGMGLQAFYGWFDDATQRTPSYDPPHDAPCLLCGRPIHEDDVRTHSLMVADSVYAKRSYFYRTHRTCDEAAKKSADGTIIDMITRNGD